MGGAIATSKVANMPVVKEQVTEGRKIMSGMLTLKKDALPGGQTDKATDEAYTIEHL